MFSTGIKTNEGRTHPHVIAHGLLSVTLTVMGFMAGPPTPDLFFLVQTLFSYRRGYVGFGQSVAGSDPTSTTHRLCGLKNSTSASISLPTEWETIIVHFSMGCCRDLY